MMIESILFKSYHYQSKILWIFKIMQIDRINLNINYEFIF